MYDSSFGRHTDDQHKTIIPIDCIGFIDTSTLVGHFVLSPRESEKREEIVEEIRERDREERNTGMKVKKQKE